MSQPEPSTSPGSSLLLTGFPGFLATRLLPRLLETRSERVRALVEPSMLPLARKRVEDFERQTPGSEGRIEVIPGDITDPGIVAAGSSLGTPSEVFHLAALYRLDVPRAAATAVNVEGTRNLLAALERIGSVRRFHHVSTCYVSGRHPGLFREQDLEVGQSFNNHYESTKYQAEMIVREAGSTGCPITIYRPSIVVGDSRTGRTAKYDGPYHLLRWIDALPGAALVPRVPGSSKAELNVIPVDFLVQALAALSRREDTNGLTFHLADPRPLKVPEFVRVSARALGKRVLAVPLPLSAARFLMAMAGRVPGMPRIPPNAVDYLQHPTRYGTDQTTPLLEEEGIRTPNFADYAERLVGYLRENPEPQNSARCGRREVG
jgi:thioester reductase-like protein